MAKAITKLWLIPHTPIKNKLRNNVNRPHTFLTMYLTDKSKIRRFKKEVSLGEGVHRTPNCADHSQPYRVNRGLDRGEGGVALASFSCQSFPAPCIDISHHVILTKGPPAGRGDGRQTQGSACWEELCSKCPNSRHKEHTGKKLQWGLISGDPRSKGAR